MFGNWMSSYFAVPMTWGRVPMGQDLGRGGLKGLCTSENGFKDLGRGSRGMGEEKGQETPEMSASELMGSADRCWREGCLLCESPEIFFKTN